MTKGFEMKFIGTGWGKITLLNHKGESFNFEFSFLTNVVSELLEALCSLLESRSSYKEVVFPEEPGETVLALTCNQDRQLQIEIFDSEEWIEISRAYGTESRRELIYLDNDILENFCNQVLSGIKAGEEARKKNSSISNWSLYQFPNELFEKCSIEIASIIGRSKSGY